LGVTEEKQSWCRPRLKNIAEPPTLQHTKYPLPSPPRPAGGGEEGDADHAGSPAVPRTRTDEELRLPPIPPSSQVRLPFPRPPRPARRQRRMTGKVQIRRQQTARRRIVLLTISASQGEDGSQPRRAPGKCPAAAAQIYLLRPSLLPSWPDSESPSRALSPCPAVRQLRPRC
jgi:hypothetical protein